MKLSTKIAGVALVSGVILGGMPVSNVINAATVKQNTVNNSKNVLGNNVHINIPTSFNSNTYAEYKSGKISADEFESRLSAGLNMNSFSSDPEDRQVKIHSSNDITQDIQENLSFYVLGIINSIRSQLGSSPVYMSKGALAMANSVVEEYERDNWQFFLGETSRGHDVEGIKRAAARNGLNSGGNYYENLGSALFFNATDGAGNVVSDWNLTLDDLKQAAFDTTMRMVFDDAGSSYGHFVSLIGPKGATGSLATPNSTFGVQYDKFGQIHFMVISPILIKSGEFDTTVISRTNPVNNEYTQIQDAVVKAPADKKVQIYGSNGNPVRGKKVPENSEWYSDRSSQINGEKVYRIATTEWVKASDVSYKTI